MTDLFTHWKSTTLNIVFAVAAVDDLNLLEDGEYGDGIDSRDEGGEEEGLQYAGRVVLPVQARLPNPPQCHS